MWMPLEDGDTEEEKLDKDEWKRSKAMSQAFPSSWTWVSDNHGVIKFPKESFKQQMLQKVKTQGCHVADPEHLRQT